MVHVVRKEKYHSDIIQPCEMDTSFHQLLHVPRTTRKEVAETSLLLRDVRLTDPSVIRRMSSSLCHLRVIFRALEMHFVLSMNIEHFVLRQSFQISPSTVPDAKSRTATSPNITLTRKSDAPRYDRKRVKRPLQARPIWERSGRDPRMNPSPPQPRQGYIWCFGHAFWCILCWNRTCRAKALIPNVKKSGACREKWHCNFNQRLRLPQSSDFARRKGSPV